MLVTADPLFIPLIDAEALDATEVTSEQIEALKALPAYRKLRWIIYRERGTTCAVLSRTLRKCGATVTCWIHETTHRRSTPEPPTQRHIEVWTEGSVIGPILADEWPPSRITGDPVGATLIDAEALDATEVTSEQIEALKALPAYRKLRWIIQNERHTTFRALALAMDTVTEAGVGRWMHPVDYRRNTPELYSRRQIQAWTEGSIIGAIRPSEWATKKEREADTVVARWEPDVRPDRAA